METNRVASTIDIAVSGLRAQSRRMNVLASNIANANTTRTDEGGPYRRKAVVLRAGGGPAGGVSVSDVVSDFSSDFKKVYEPGNPDADGEGYVAMPNVDLPVEMMNMVTASRAYQANAAILKRYQESVDVTLELLR
jgi:flagellar basal-body rod protein FlgC